MSLLNQVLQDLDERLPSEERQPIRLSVAPPLQRHIDADGSGTGPDHMRLWMGLIVIAVYVGAVWAFYPAERSTGSRPVVDLQTPAPAAVIMEFMPQETPARALAPKGSAGRHARHEPDGPLTVLAGVAEKPGSEVTMGAGGLLVPETSAARPTPVEQGPLESAATPGEPDQPLSAGSRGESAASYLPLRNTELPTFETSRPQPDSSKSATSPKVKTARSPMLQSLEAARREIERGEVSYAEHLLQQRLRGSSNDREARELLIGLMLRGERYDAALRQLDEGLRHDPGHIKFALIKASLLAQTGQDATAIRILEALPPSGTGRVRSLQMLGALYQKQSRYEQARDRYRALLRITPTAGPAWAGLALSLDGLGDPAALETYGRALDLGGLPAAADAYARQRIDQMGSKVD